MKKLRLEELSVESFVTTHGTSIRGTVGARQASGFECSIAESCWMTCAGGYTCANTCENSCGPQETCTETMNPEIFTCGGNGSGGGSTAELQTCNVQCGYHTEQ
jgi:hypothetical protein